MFRFNHAFSRRGCSAICVFQTLLLGSSCGAQCSLASQASPWSPAAPISGIPVNRLIRWPSLSVSRDTIYLAGNLLPIEGDSISMGEVHLRKMPGGVLPKPAGAFQFVYPKIVVGGKGEVHLIWAEFDSVRLSAARWGSATIKTALWHSVMTGSEWAPAERIYEAPALEWTGDGSHVAVDQSGDLHVVVWAFAATTVGIVHLRRSQAGWRAVGSPRASMSKASGVRSSNDSVFIAFVPLVIGSLSKSLEVQMSANRGDTWSAPIVVRPSGTRGVELPQFISVGNLTVLAWGESAPQRFGIDSLRLVSIGAEGNVEPLAALALPPGSFTFAIAATRCGEVSILVDEFSQHPRTMEITLDRQGVSEPRPLWPRDELTTFAAIAAGERLLTAVLATRLQPGHATAVSTVRRACQGNVVR